MINDEVKVVIYDYETDGLFTNKGYNRPVQVACAIIEPDNEVKIINKYIKRRKGARPLSECIINYWDIKKDPSIEPISITDLTGITDEIVEAEGFEIEDVFAELNDVFNSENTVIVGHNIVNFDNKFTNQRFDKYGHRRIELDYCFDTGGEFKSILLNSNKFDDESFGSFHKRILSIRAKGVYFRLDKAVEYYGIELTDKDREERHNALQDIKQTGFVFIEQMKRYGDVPERFVEIKEKLTAI